MLQKLFKLAHFIPPDQYQRDPLNLTKNYQGKHILFMCFDFHEGQWIYRETQLEEYDDSKLHSYLFRAVSGRGSSDFPTLDIFKPDELISDHHVDFERSTQGKKLLNILKKNAPILDALIHELQTNHQIGLHLAETIENLIHSGVKRFALSFKLDGDYLGSSKYYSKKIDEMNVNLYNEAFATYKNKRYEGTSGQPCALTKAPASKVWGYASPFAFYACKTEYGGISGGFDPTQAWKNFPVSPEASLQLERAAEFVTDHLSFRFGGYDYFLIPEKIGYGAGEEFLEFIKDFQKVGLGQTGRDNAQVEMDVLSILKEQNNSGNFSFYFYEKNNAEFKLLVSIDDVFPSRIHRIIQAAEWAESLPCFKALPAETKGEFYDIRFTFQTLKRFLPDTKIEGSFRHGFLSVLRNIFLNRPISKSYLLDRIMKEIQVAFANEKKFKKSISSHVRHAYMLLRFLQHLNLIQQDPDPVYSRKPTMTSFDSKFFEKHAPFFEQPPHLAALKKALFLEGVLCKKLLNYQYRQKGAMPFRSRLNGLKLNERIIRRIYHEMIEKLDQYGINHYYANLETAISRYFLEAQFELADDEYAFYFVMGMTLAKDVYSAEEEPEEEGP